MNKTTLNAQRRDLLGRKVKKLRREGLMPGNVYGKKVESMSVSVEIKDLEKTYKKVGETGLLELVVDGKTRPVLIHNVQTHPVTDEFLHVDFLQVNLNEKVKTQIPLEMVGVSPAEKSGMGTVVQYLNEIEVEALPGDLPDKFEIDTSKLIDLESAVLISDLKYDKNKVEILDQSDQILAKVEPPQEEVVEEPVSTQTDEEASEEKAQPEENKSEETSDDSSK